MFKKVSDILKAVTTGGGIMLRHFGCSPANANGI